MMRLSQLLKLREDLMALDISKVEASMKFLRSSSDAINFLGYDNSELVGCFDDVTASLKSVKSKHLEFLKRLEEDINRNRAEYLEKCEADGPNYLHSTIIKERETRVMNFNPGVEDIIRARIGQYVSWETPGLEIGPGDGKWTECLVSQDPLYLVDIHQEFLNSTADKFNPAYRPRLRKYLTKGFDLRSLPREQMGFVFSWNVFNYLTLSMIEKYLTEIKMVMRPGGILMFSFNNCDLYKSVEMFERTFMTFVPSSELLKITKRLGFELVTCQNADTHISWVELRKPGKLETNRAGQTLGKIIDKNA